MVRKNGIWGSVGCILKHKIIKLWKRNLWKIKVILYESHQIIHPNLVCDDQFHSIDAESACYTLGYPNGGTFGTFYKQSGQAPWSEDEIPILMDDVKCASASESFLTCATTTENCSHNENVFVICFESG